MQSAELKGFRASENVKSIMLADWMPVAEIFANTVCVALQWWLRTKHKIDVWVEPVVPERYKGFVRYFGIHKAPNEYDSDISRNYEMQFIGALDFAIKSLPPAAQEQS